MERVHLLEDFSKFTAKLQTLGVIRQTYDVLQDEIAFYSKNAMLYHFPVSALDKASSRKLTQIATTLNTDRLKQAIKNIDERKISVGAFHEELANSGIVYVSVYLQPKTIYYFAQNGEYYLEKY